MRQNASQVSEEALVDSKNTFRADGLQQAVKNTLVEVTSLVIHASHNRVCKSSEQVIISVFERTAHTWRMHEAAHHKARSGTTGKMQSRAFFHAKVSGETSLSKEIGRELNSTAKAGTNHSSSHSPIDTLDTFTFINLAQSVK